MGAKHTCSLIALARGGWDSQRVGEPFVSRRPGHPALLRSLFQVKGRDSNDDPQHHL